MIKFAGFGRTLAATLIVSAGLAGVAKAQEVTDEQIKTARSAIDAIGATSSFDNILPSLAMRVKSTFVQASPNHEAEINAVVDEQALALAPRRADLEKEAATIYAKTFTQEELKAIADFYGSAVGKKLLADGPIATREVMKAAEIWASGVDRDLRTESSKKLDAMVGATKPAEGGEAQPQQQ
ncbi:DUF2059 domain-containing protein [Shinella zoogloeoides]|jgi:hypothetical protein|uniref:DUF2059 domain-containing protein n=1 Tax=Shinella zoogloeoides TaxID=352475 RepID=A0A6N8TCN9_SHIZO|nr:DUF2059 domain-containing protein [Shinella zoogloeoides]MXN98973.1 DUF2059 domain-containing protein [Shinella zoogloeoides]UEX83411.1 DUF2059 domain-containing protein [Shinella zoogloeoides]